MSSDTQNALERFVGQTRELFARESDPEVRWRSLGPALADLLAENAEDFQATEGINHSLAHLFRLLAGGHISTRRATGLAYIASLLLRTLPDIRQISFATNSGVPARGRVGMSPDEEPPNLPEDPSSTPPEATRTLARLPL